MSKTHQQRQAEMDARWAAERAAKLADMSERELIRKAREIDDLSCPSGYAVNHRGQGGGNQYRAELTRRAVAGILETALEAAVAI